MLSSTRDEVDAYYLLTEFAFRTLKYYLAPTTASKMKSWNV